MATTIWKYDVTKKPGDLFELEMPVGAIIRHVARKDYGNAMWVEVDEHADKEMRRFIWYGTGWTHAIGHTEWHVATLLLDPYVWHLYERKSA